jgi:CspA family cold shock protein
MERQTGTVVKFDGTKGYGFIARQGAADVFVHFSQILMDGYRTLEVGSLVEFDVAAGDRGLMAVDVVPLTEGEESR